MRNRIRIRIRIRNRIAYRIRIRNRIRHIYDTMFFPERENLRTIRRNYFYLFIYLFIYLFFFGGGES